MPTRRTGGKRSDAGKVGVRAESRDSETAYTNEPYVDEDSHDAAVDAPQEADESYADEAPAAMSAASAAKAGLRHIIELTGREPAGVTSLEPADDNGWLVGVEVIEDRRVPSSTDVLALYQARIDADGGLVAYSRKRRYSRGQAGEEQ